MEGAPATHSNIISLSDKLLARCEKDAERFVPPGYGRNAIEFGSGLETEIETLHSFLSAAARTLAVKAVRGVGDGREAALVLRCAQKTEDIAKGIRKLERKLEKAKSKARR